MSLFYGAKIEKTKKLGGNEVHVGYFNGQVVAAVRNGKLTIMNERLVIMKEFAGTTRDIRSLCGNATYLAICDLGGFVRYYKKNSSVHSYYTSHKHDDKANSVQVKNNLVISGSSDNTVQVWNMERHEKLWEFDHGHSVWSIILRDDQVITCCQDKSVRVLSLESGEELHRLEHSSRCFNADLNPNKSVLAVACGKGVVFWDVRNAVKIEEFDLGIRVHDLRFNPSGDKLIVGLADGQVFKFELE